MPPQLSGQQPLPPTNFDFIMNSGQSPQPTGMGGGSMVKRILVVVGGLTVLVVIATIVINVLSGSSASFNESAVLSVAQDQTEIIRVSTAASSDAVSQSIKNSVATTQSGMTSEQQILLTYLAEAGYSPSPQKELPLKASAQTDGRLAEAKSSSSYDTAYKSIMQQQLQTYQADLKAAFDGASPAAQSVLSARFDAATLLLKQLQAAD